jgi:hypothetical protein
MITQATTVHAARRLLTLDGRYNTRIQVSPLLQTLSRPKQELDPRDKLCLARVRSRLPAPREPRRRPLLQQFGHDLGQTSTSPEPGSDLDVRNRRTPDVIRNCRADALVKKPFPILSMLCQPLQYGQPLARGLGYVTEPSGLLASALNRNQAGISQQQVHPLTVRAQLPSSR